MLFAPGALTTRMPRALAASTSTLSTPVPARAMTRSLGAASSSARIDVRRAANKECVRVRNVGGERGRLASGARIHHPIGFRAQQLDRGRRQIIGDDDFRERLEV